ncbi:MAG TPA: tetratricopeptide repeat protein [Gemmatirosa sp.]
MQSLVDEFKGAVSTFAAQRDDVALVVRARDGEAPLVFALLEQLEDELPAAMCWLVNEEFRGVADFVAMAVATFAARHGAVRQAMLARGDAAPWPELPAALRDDTYPPVERLREAMIFSRRLLPFPAEMVVLWGLFPLVVHDPDGWAWLHAQLLPHQLPDPWCRGIRVLSRAMPDDATLPHTLTGMPRVRWTAPDFAPDAVARALEQDATDPARPLFIRMQGLFASATTDGSYGRIDAALQKYALVLKYALGTENAALAALTLNGLGELHARAGHDAQAVRCFEAAVEPAAAAPGPPVPILLNIALNLGGVRTRQGQWAAAEPWYDGAQALATVQRDANTKLHAIEQLGTCQYMQAKFAHAERTWQAGAHVAGELQLTEVRLRMLGLLHHLYGYIGDGVRQAGVARAMAAHPVAVG